MFTYHDCRQLTWICRLETKAETVVGDDILYLHPNADYNVHFPIQRGDINLTPLVGQWLLKKNLHWAL